MEGRPPSSVIFGETQGYPGVLAKICKNGGALGIQISGQSLVQPKSTVMPKKSLYSGFLLKTLCKGLFNRDLTEKTVNNHSRGIPYKVFGLPPPICFIFGETQGYPGVLAKICKKGGAPGNPISRQFGSKSRFLHKTTTFEVKSIVFPTLGGFYVKPPL
jgi:hypothetical protein